MDLSDLVQIYPVGAGRASVTIAGTAFGGIGGVVPTAEAERNAAMLREAIFARYQLELARKDPHAVPQNERERICGALAVLFESILSTDAQSFELETLERVTRGLEELCAQLAAGRQGPAVVVGRPDGAGQVDDSKSAAE